MAVERDFLSLVSCTLHMNALMLACLAYASFGHRLAVLQGTTYQESPTAQKVDDPPHNFQSILDLNQSHATPVTVEVPKALRSLASLLLGVKTAAGWQAAVAKSHHCKPCAATPSSFRGMPRRQLVTSMTRKGSALDLFLDREEGMPAPEPDVDDISWEDVVNQAQVLRHLRTELNCLDTYKIHWPRISKVSDTAKPRSRIYFHVQPTSFRRERKAHLHKSKSGVNTALLEPKRHAFHAKIWTVFLKRFRKLATIGLARHYKLLVGLLIGVCGLLLGNNLAGLCTASMGSMLHCMQVCASNQVFQATSIAGAADAFVQKTSRSHRLKGYDIRRTMSFAAFGMWYCGNVSPFIYRQFDRWFGVGNSLGCVLPKLFSDVFIHAPLLYIPCFYLTIGMVQGKGWSKSIKNLQHMYFPTLLSYIVIWLAPMFFFFRYVPESHRVLYLALVSFVEKSIYSFMGRKSSESARSSGEEKLPPSK